jgi:hypothetical protein
MSQKCKICGEKKYPILSSRKCVRCAAKSKEDIFIRLYPNKEIKFKSQFLVDEYVINSKSVREIAKMCGLSNLTVNTWLGYYGIKTRTKEDLKNKINSNFFSKINADSAFLLGYIFTDGDLQYNQKFRYYFLRLYSKYKTNLQMVLKLIKSDAKIQQRKAVMTDAIRQGKISFIHIADKKFINDLMGFGMIKNKNSSIKFPNIPAEFISHFIRGCWAGSGCIYFSKEGSIIARFTNGSLEFITHIEKELNKAGCGKRKIYQHKHTKSPSYYFSYATGDSSILHRYLYRDARSKNSVKHHTVAFEKHFGNKNKFPIKSL